jgi:hypothetical protein
MNNNLQYNLLIRDYAEHILLSLNSNYRNYIKFGNKRGKLSKCLYLDNFERVISLIACNIFVRGQQKVYIYEKDQKNVISLDKHKGEKILSCFTIRFPKKIMCNHKRRKLLKKISKMNYPILSENNNYDDYCRDSLYIMDLIDCDFEKITRKILSVDSRKVKCTDIYILYREIQKRKSQTILVNTIFNKINENLAKSLNIEDESDVIIFDCMSLEKLNDIEKSLILGNIKVDEVSNMLFKR